MSGLEQQRRFVYFHPARFLGLRPWLLHQRRHRVEPRRHEPLGLSPAEQVAQAVQVMPDATAAHRAAASVRLRVQLLAPRPNVGHRDGVERPMRSEEVQRPPKVVLRFGHPSLRGRPCFRLGDEVFSGELRQRRLPGQAVHRAPLAPRAELIQLRESFGSEDLGDPEICRRQCLARHDERLAPPSHVGIVAEVCVRALRATLLPPEDSSSLSFP